MVERYSNPLYYTMNDKSQQSLTSSKPNENDATLLIGKRRSKVLRK